MFELLHCFSQIEGSVDKYLCGAAWINYLKLSMIPFSLSWQLLHNSRKHFFLLWETKLSHAELAPLRQLDARASQQLQLGRSNEEGTIALQGAISIF